MIDTHCHIYDIEYDDDRAAVVEASKKAGVEALMLANVNYDSIGRIEQMKKEYPDFVFTSVGLHPEEVKGDYKEQLELLKQHIDPSCTAIGEVGIDLYFTDEFKAEQIEALDIQIQWAIEYDLPLLLHVRKGYAEIFQILSKYKNANLRGVFHCFSGGIEEAKKAVSLGFYLGIGGIVTFKNSNLKEILQQIDIEHIVLETDAPYLAPVPMRGKRNEPAFMFHTAAKLAEVYSLSIDEIDHITTRNAKALFGLVEKK